MRQQLDALREQMTQMRQRPTSQGAAFDALVASSKTNEKLAKAIGNSINRSNSVTSKAPESLIRFIQECPLDDKADFGYQVEEMLRSMFDIFAAEQMLRSGSSGRGLTAANKTETDYLGKVQEVLVDDSGASSCFTSPANKEKAIPGTRVKLARPTSSWWARRVGRPRERRKSCSFVLSSHYRSAGQEQVTTIVL